MSPFRLAVVALSTLGFACPAAAQPASQVITVYSFGFAPRPIHLAAGRPVTLTFVNRAGSGHDFTARAFFARSQILSGSAPAGEVELGGGQTRSITLIPRAGTYPAHCGHFMHKQLGMSD